MSDEIPSQAEAERRAEWLHSRGAPHDWIILRVGEVATIKGELATAIRERDKWKDAAFDGETGELLRAELATLRAELAEARAEVQKVNEFRERLAGKHRLACDERDAALAKLGERTKERDMMRERIAISLSCTPAESAIHARIQEFRADIDQLRAKLAEAEREAQESQTDRVRRWMAMRV